MAEDLREQFERLEEMQNSAERGREFENFVWALFIASHFEVIKDPGTASPRQTDLLALQSGDVYLIECKWRTSRADIADVDGLRARLGRTNKSATGLLIAMAGFSGTAISEVAGNRGQPILLMSGDEIRRLARRPDELRQLLWQKKQALLVNGTALVDEPPEQTPSRRRWPLPSSEARIVVSDQPDSTVLPCGGGFDRFTYAHELVDVDWVIAKGMGVTLDVDIPAVGETDVLDVLDKLAALGWASRDARWSIQQSRMNYHGFGAAAFAEELGRWQSRAERADAHHSEEFCYVDNCDGGFYTLSSTIGAHEKRRATQTHLSFQLQGVPLDTGPLLQLCRSIGVHDGVYFRSLTDRSRRVLHLPKWLTTPTKPVGLVCEPGIKDGRRRHGMGHGHRHPEPATRTEVAAERRTSGHGPLPDRGRRVPGV
ncbi:restriction endonuclease [Asanoa sp. NPDC049518]|uniref:restriction endonuclease n=1 Tax=unclassified Asanoa TaxID=2685164 RepID=UPI0034291D9B